MTATEDRLTDALHAAARSVTTPTLRPLGEALAPRQAPADPRHPRRPRRRWLAAVASAAAVALIATAVVVVSAQLRTAPPAGAGAPPRYYVGIEDVANPRLVVRATATGRVTAVVSKPGEGRGQFAIVADGTGRGTFFAEWVPYGAVRTVSIRIYRFRVTMTGRVTDMARVPGGDLGPNIANTMAVSANGARLALAVQPYGHASPPIPNKIIVISLRTGERTNWAGARAPHGQDPRSLQIVQLSWTAGGRELVYLAQWTCPSPRHGQKCVILAAPGGYEQVRTLDPASRGGSLDSGRLLVNAPGGYLGAAAISPDGATLTEVVQWTVAGAVSGARYQEFRITPVDVQTGRPGRVRYQVRLGRSAIVRIFQLSPSGQYLFAVGGTPTHTINGWIADDRLHRLPPAGLWVSSETW